MKNLNKIFITILLGGILLINHVNGLEELQINGLLNTEKVIAIGSTNRIKIQSVKNALDNENFKIVSCSAESNVRPQPISDEETLQGAINRAKDSLQKMESSLAIGLEAGVVFLQEQIYLCHWGAIVDNNNNIYFTNGPLILLPKEYRTDLLNGKNLEEIMHNSTGIENLGSKQGAISVFTQKRLDREQVLTQIVKALIGQYYFYQKTQHE